MPHKKILNTLALTILVLSITACTHPLDIEGQGDIRALDNSRECLAEQAPCNIVTTDAYQVSYKAQARTGWAFKGWSGCPTVEDNICVIDTSAETVRAFWGKTLGALIAHFSPINNINNVNLPASSKGAWEPTFVDNFNGTNLNMSAWVPGRGVLDKRLNYYDKEAVEVKLGKLHLKVINKAESDRPYTTGAITSQGLFKQRYGYFEMRAKSQAGNGFWPAFWLMPESGNWSSEIDIAEFMGHEPDSILYAYHYDYTLHNEHTLAAPVIFDLSQSFNNFAVHWTPERIDYLFNGVVMHSAVGADLVAKANEDMYLILNVALASQHTAFIPVVDNDSDLSQAFEIDYVRVYKESEQGQYEKLPASLDSVPDLVPEAYDNTALSVDRVNPSNNPDVLRTPSQISGGIKLSSHKDNYEGLVSVFLKQRQGFDSNSGYFSYDVVIDEAHHTVVLDKRGDIQVIDYDFSPTFTSPGVYSIDVLIRDTETQNKVQLSSHRTVQYVDSNLPNTSLLFEGFIRDGSANYANGTIQSTIQLQLQQSLLSPYLIAQYSVVDTLTGEVLSAKQETIEHNKVGLIRLSPSFDIGTIDSSRSLGIIVEASDSRGRYKIAAKTIAITR